MQQPISEPLRATPAPQRNWLNAIPNVLWSALLIAPVYIFCYRYMHLAWVYGFGAASLLPYLLPASLMRSFELSQQPATYRRLRVHLMNRMTQHGSFINGLVRGSKLYAPHLRDRAALAHHERTTRSRERFHMAMFTFFLLTTLYAAAERKVGWAMLLLPINVIYNLYPIWLLQYVRLRLKLVRNRC